MATLTHNCVSNTIIQSSLSTIMVNPKFSSTFFSSGVRLSNENCKKNLISAAFSSPIPSILKKVSIQRNFCVSEGATESVAEEELEEVLEEEVESVDESGVPGTSIGSILAKLKEAIASNNETDITEAQLQLEAIEKDRLYLSQQIESLTDEVSLGKDRLLRLNADFENFRKRADREKKALANSVRGDVVEQLLPMIDNFERAKTALKTETEAEQKIANGYQSIYKQFVDAMKALGVTAVATSGVEFDPKVHDAIMREDSTELTEGMIIEEFRKGFVIGDRLLRPAMVKVSAGPGPATYDFDEEATIAEEEDISLGDNEI